MSSDIYRLIPELNQQQLRDSVSKNTLFSKMTPVDQETIVLLYLNKIQMFFSHEYFPLDGSIKYVVNMAAWGGGFYGLTLRQIFGGLFFCLTGRTKYIDKPPPNVIAFYAICKEAEFPRDNIEPLPALEHKTTDGETIPPGYRKKTPAELARSEAIAAVELAKMREILGKHTHVGKKGNLKQGIEAMLAGFKPSPIVRIDEKAPITPVEPPKPPDQPTEPPKPESAPAEPCDSFEPDWEVVKEYEENGVKRVAYII